MGGCERVCGVCVWCMCLLVPIPSFLSAIGSLLSHTQGWENTYLYSLHLLSLSPSPGLIHEDLQVFLEANLPSGKKAKKVVLGVSDGKLGGSIQEQLGIKCESGGSVLEVTRGIRLYFTKLVKGQ